ncbi:hypothetical protein, partial [Metallibacterium scheffleri]|uniref:hypothetical protein n=1 Tax=Metallibacterium scheffleri TaxID=993689 RepID=UPI0023EFA07C
IYKFGVSRTWITSSLNISIDNKSVDNTSRPSGSYTNFSLHPFYKYVPGTTIMFKVSGSTNFRNLANTAVVYYYDTSLSGSNVRIS